MRSLSLTNPLMQGDDVKHAQRMLNKYLGDKAPRLKIDGHFGSVTGQNCRIAKFRLGFPKAQCQRTYGQVLDNYLSGESKPTAAMKARAKKYVSSLNTRAKVRAAIVANAKWGVSHSSQIHYQQLRPIEGLKVVRKLPLHTDCSGFATLCYKWAAAPDPNGFRYNGYGYTGSLMNHMANISRSQLKPGDLVVFGYYPGEHVVIYIGNGKVISHGKEGDPKAATLAAYEGSFSGPTNYLRLPEWR